MRTTSDFPSLPGELPIIGHLLKLRHHAMDALWQGYRELGPVFYINMGPSLRFLTCFGPETIGLFKHKAIGTDELAFGRYRLIVAESAILAQEGARHQQLRSLMKGPFSPAGMSAQGIGKLVFSTVSEGVRSWVQAGHVPALGSAQKLALDVVFRIVGIKTGELDAWRHQYRELTLSLLPVPIRLPGFPHYRAEQAYVWINQRLRAAIHAAQRAPLEDNLLSALVHSRDEAGHEMSESELLDNLRFMFFAGHETTASVMAWALIVLAQHPELWDALCQECKTTSADGPTSVQEAKQFPVAEAIFRETLRRYGPVWYTMRRTLDWVELGGRRIPPNRRVILSPACVGMDPQVFPKPEVFDIGRWLERKAPLGPAELSHFGSAQHFCLGYHIAWLELIVLLTSLARELAPTGRRPRIRGRAAPREEFLPLRHPSAACVVELS